MEAMRKETGAHENGKHWTLVRIRELNRKKTFMSIWSLKIKRDPYVRLIKHEACLFDHVGMHKWGVKYWETYSLVINWISIRSILNLIILRDIQVVVSCIKSI